MTYLLAKAVIVGARPFSLFEDDLFRDAFSLLPFNYQPPNGNYVGGLALNQAHEEIQAQSMRNATMAFAITICSDGWTDRRHNGLHNVMICTPNPFYFQRIQQQTEKADANYVFDILEKGRAAILSEYAAIGKPAPFMFAYLTDSTNVMRAARVKNENVIGHGCPSHALNNFSKDVAKNCVVAKLIKLVTNLHSFFRNSHRPLQYLQECMKTHLHKVVNLPSYGKTRFATIDTLLTACGSAKAAFVAYCNYGLHDDTFDVDLPHQIKMCVQSPTFWYSIAATTHLTHKIMYGIKYLEGDCVPASATVAVFLFIKKVLHDFCSHVDYLGYRDALNFLGQELERLNKCLDRRWMRIRHPVLYLAFMLDPLFICLRRDGVTTLGGESVQVGAMQALEWVIQLKVDSVQEDKDSTITKDPAAFKSVIVQQYSDFLMNAHNHSLLTENQLLHPVVSWGLLQCYWPQLAEHVALPVLSLVASPSAGERNFKVASRIDSDTRLRIGVVKADKQIACVYNYHQNKNLLNCRLPPRDSDFMIMFRSMTGPLSAFGPDEMARYNQLMAIQKAVLLVVNSKTAPRQDVDLTHLILDDDDDVFDDDLDIADVDDVLCSSDSGSDMEG